MFGKHERSIMSDSMYDEYVFVSMESFKGIRRDFKRKSLKGKVHDTIPCKTIVGLWYHMEDLKEVYYQMGFLYVS